MKNQLEMYRIEIDKIDKQLIKLLSMRCNVVKNVGKYKKQNNLTPLDNARWQKVLDIKIKEAEHYNLDKDFIVDIWNRIHNESLRIEK